MPIHKVEWTEVREYSAEVEVPWRIDDEHIEEYCYEIVMNEYEDKDITAGDCEVTSFEVGDAE